MYISPESIIANLRYHNMVLSPTYKTKLIGIAIDEAHCVKTWGDEFRVAFLRLSELRSLLQSDVKFIALTATATRLTFDTICNRLWLNQPVLVAPAPNRDNIRYCVDPKVSTDDLFFLLV